MVRLKLREGVAFWPKYAPTKNLPAFKAAKVLMEAVE